MEIWALRVTRCLLSVGDGGATVGPGPKCIEQFMSTVIHFQPDIIYLYLGENDFRSTHHDHPSLIASRISVLVRRLSDRVPVIFVSQLFSFPVSCAVQQLPESSVSAYTNSAVLATQGRFLESAR